MPIAPTNQSKNSVSLVNKVKTRLAQAIYGQGVYGIAVYGVGIPSSVLTNQTKSSTGTTTLQQGSPIGLLLSLTYASDIIIGSGITNQSKS